MELQQLRYLLAVAKTGNFSRAAESCHVAQPSLSQQIQKLEGELGARLVDRLKRRAVLTKAGEALASRAARILSEVDAARRDAEESDSMARGQVTVGVLPTIAPYLLPPVLSAFGKAWPGMEVIVQENTTALLLQMCEACELDLAIVSEPAPPPKLAGEMLFSEELLLALPRDHRLAKQAKIRLSDLDSERFILMKEGHCLGDQALKFCDRQDFHPQITFRSAQLETIHALVMAGLGISLVPAMARTKGRDAKVVYRSLEKPRPTRSVMALWRKEHHHHKAADAFLKILREVGREFEGSLGR